jgi:hypothetical protein
MQSVRDVISKELDTWGGLQPHLTPTDLDLIATELAAFINSFPHQSSRDRALAQLTGDCTPFIDCFHSGQHPSPGNVIAALGQLANGLLPPPPPFIWRPTEAATQFWAAVVGAEQFSKTAAPGELALTCQAATRDALSPNPDASPSDFQVGTRLCDHLEGWGAYWCVRLARAGIIDPKQLNAESWRQELDSAFHNIKHENMAKQSLIKELNIPEQLQVKNKLWTQDELVEQYADNMQLLCWLKSDCEKKEPCREVVAISDSRGVLQAAAIYKDEVDSLYVRYLATAPWNLVADRGSVGGAGRAAIHALIGISSQKHHGGKLYLHALKLAKPFYEHLGFQEKGNSMLYQP